MKTIKIAASLLGLSALLLLNSCAETITQEEHRAEIASIVEADENERDSLEKSYIATLDEIDNNLDAIRGKEGAILLGKKTSDDNLSKRDQIIGNISAINTLLDENREKLAKMEKSLASYKSGKKELLKSINQAKERMALQEQEISDLKRLLQENDFKIAELSRKLDEQTALAQNMTAQNTALTEQNITLDKEVNRVYFVSGTYKELKSSNILVKEGGVLGIGRVKALNKNLDKSKFSELSQRDNTTLVLKGKKPKIITRHPINSYTVSATGDDMAQLTIKDPNSFWSTSKYLVVEVH